MFKSLILPAVVVGMWAASATAQSFNIDVGPLGLGPGSGYPAAGQSGFWNVVRADQVTPFTTGPTPQDVMLVDIYGNQTGVGFHQYGGLDLVDTTDPDLTGNDANLMNDFLATHSLTLESCMYLNGLQDGTYEVLVYAWMPNQPSIMQKVRFDNNPGFELVGGDWPGQHVEGITYSRHTIEVTGGLMAFHVGIPSGGNTSIGAAWNGIQLNYLDAGPVVPTLSEWGVIVLALLLVVAGAFVFRRAPRLAECSIS